MTSIRISVISKMADLFTDSGSINVERKWTNQGIIPYCCCVATIKQLKINACGLFVFALIHGNPLFSSHYSSCSFQTAKKKKSLQLYWQWCVLLCDNVYGPDMCNTVLTLLYISFVCIMPIIFQLMSCSQLGKCECYTIETPLSI